LTTVVLYGTIVINDVGGVLVMNKPVAQCSCGFAGTRTQVVEHYHLLMPCRVSFLSVERGYITQEKYDDAVRDYEKFKQEHQIN
jgi:hypothetical protein